MSGLRARVDGNRRNTMQEGRTEGGMYGIGGYLVGGGLCGNLVQCKVPGFYDDPRKKS